MNLNLGYTKEIIEEASKRGLLRNQLAYVLATTYWESGKTMKPVREAYYLEGKVKDVEAWRKRNLRYFPYYGRGFVQLTWDYNYKKADEKLKLNGTLIKNLDRALEPEIAKQTLVVGMIEGWFTGKKLSDYITLKKSDFVEARRIINGTDEAQTIADFAVEYNSALKKAGYGEEMPVEGPKSPVQPVQPIPAIETPEITEKPSTSFLGWLLRLLLGGKK